MINRVPVIDAGRATLDALLAGRDAAAARWRRHTNGHRSYLWLGLGALGAVALALGGRRVAQHAAPRTKRVEDVMIRDVETISGSATIAEAARRMRDSNVGVLPIVEGGRMKAVVTDRDLVVRALATGVDPATAIVADYATRDPIVSRPDWPVERAMEMMAEQQVGRLPVVDDEGRLVGIVTLGSLAVGAPEKDETLDTARKVSLRSARAA